MKLEVLQIGWSNEQVFPVVLMSKQMRVELEVNVGDIVRVCKDSKKSLAIVQLQFKELVGKKGCTLSTKLGEEIADVEVGNKVDIKKDVLESEHNAFRESVNVTLRDQIAEYVSHNPQADAPQDD